ncbi:MAG: hypothetical protein ACRC2J_17410 [Microcoleaceae cyanobacterium]
MFRKYHVARSLVLNIHEICGGVSETMATVSLWLTRPWGNS